MCRNGADSDGSAGAPRRQGQGDTMYIPWERRCSSQAGPGLEEVFVFVSKSENRDRSAEAVDSVSEVRAVWGGSGLAWVRVSVGSGLAWGQCGDQCGGRG